MILSSIFFYSSLFICILHSPAASCRGSVGLGPPYGLMNLYMVMPSRQRWNRSVHGGRYAKRWQWHIAKHLNHKERNERKNKKKELWVDVPENSKQQMQTDMAQVLKWKQNRNKFSLWRWYATKCRWLWQNNWHHLISSYSNILWNCLCIVMERSGNLYMYVINAGWKTTTSTGTTATTTTEIQIYV